MNTFKAGDKVYFPMQTTKVCTLIESRSMSYPFAVFLKYSLEVCTALGQCYGTSGVSSIFHATQENKELLEKLHGVEFEAAPPKTKTKTVTFERPETFIPHRGEDYWYINNVSDNGVGCETNIGTLIDRMCIKRGVWRTKEEALMVANAIFNLMKE